MATSGKSAAQVASKHMSGKRKTKTKAGREPKARNIGDAVQNARLVSSS